jgi:hypothetical protein
MKKLWLTLLYAGIRLGLPVRNVVRYGVRSLSNPVQLYGCASTSVRDASSTLTCSALWVSIVVCGAAVHNCVVAAVRRVQVPVAIYQVGGVCYSPSVDDTVVAGLTAAIPHAVALDHCAASEAVTV